MRVNYIYGSYAKDGSGAPQRGGHGGNFLLDTFRLNLDFNKQGWIGKAEYRWYDGYNFLHTGWLGFESEEFGHLEAGLVRTPFGIGLYGPSHSFFFDQHYYLGLSDNMKLGTNYKRTHGAFTWELGYFLRDMVNGRGASGDSARYSYAVVKEDVGGIPGAYALRHQVNARLSYHLESISTTLGTSALIGQLNARDDRAGNSKTYALSVHSDSQWGPYGLKLQLTGYEFDTDYKADANGVRPNKGLINMGAYEFAWPVAARGLVPSAAASYTIENPCKGVDSVTFYNDFSIIIKDSKRDDLPFNNSALNITGVSIAKGGWFIYVNHAMSNGNLFIGNHSDEYADTYAESSVGDLGANRNDRWNRRFNINVGYYF